MVLERFTNNAFTDLTQSVSLVAVVVSVFDQSVFPTSPEFRIKINSELMLVTLINVNRFTVERGIEGTIVTTHSIGDLVELVLTADSLVKVIEQEYQQNIATFAEATLNGSVYVMELNPTLTAYTPGLKIFFKADSKNSGSTSVNVDALGIIEIKKSADDSLENNDIQAGQVVGIIYDGAFFQLIADIVEDALIGTGDELVRASSFDFTSGFLEDKFVTGAGLTSVIDTSDTSSFKLVISVNSGNAGDFVYSAFGLDTNASTSIKDVDKYAISLDAWFAFAQEINPARQDPFGYSFDSNAIVAYGSSAEGTGNTDSFLLSTETWLSRLDGPNPRSFGSGFPINNNFAYYCGGQIGASVLDLNERYDNTFDTWELRTPMLSIRLGHSGFQLADTGIGYIVGGSNSLQAPQIFDNLDKYTESNNSWVSLTDLLSGRQRQFGTAFADPFANKGFYACGQPETGELTDFDFFDEYQESGSVWTALLDTPPTIGGFGLSSQKQVGNSTFVQVFGGFTVAGNRRDNLRYDTNVGQWLTKLDLPQPGRSFTASFAG